MKRFYSLSQFPGKTGEKFYNSMFKKLNMECEYTALKCEDILVGISEMKSMNADGFSISMPYKKSVIQYLDYNSSYVDEFESCNTVVVRPGIGLCGYTTDIDGVNAVLSKLPPLENISILGDGSIGSMFKKVIGHRANVYSRKLGTWDKIHDISGIVINCTSFGTSTYDSPFTELPSSVTHVIDLAIKPNQLEKQCAGLKTKYVSGSEFYKHQFIKQFFLYTGILLSIGDVNKI